MFVLESDSFAKTCALKLKDTYAFLCFFNLFLSYHIRSSPSTIRPTWSTLVLTYHTFPSLLQFLYRCRPLINLARPFSTMSYDPPKCNHCREYETTSCIHEIRLTKPGTGVIMHAVILMISTVTLVMRCMGPSDALHPASSPLDLPVLSRHLNKIKAR